MARIAGVDLPGHKKIDIALTSIYGIGRSSAVKIEKKLESILLQKQMIYLAMKLMLFEKWSIRDMLSRATNDEKFR